MYKNNKDEIDFHKFNFENINIDTIEGFNCITSSKNKNTKKNIKKILKKIGNYLLTTLVIILIITIILFLIKILINH